MKEKWRVIEEFPNYEVSSLGRVRSLKTGTIKKPFISDQGYYKVQLYKKSKKSNQRVHRLVAKAFIANPGAKPQINHKNVNRLDNCVANLEWVTDEENLEHYRLLSSKT